MVMNKWVFLAKTYIKIKFNKTQKFSLFFEKLILRENIETIKYERRKVNNNLKSI